MACGVVKHTYTHLQAMEAMDFLKSCIAVKKMKLPMPLVLGE